LQRIRRFKGTTSLGFLVLIGFLIALSILLVSGVGYNAADYNTTGINTTPAQSGSEQTIVVTTPGIGKESLQLHTFGILSPTPLPIPSEYNIQTPAVCTAGGVNDVMLIIDNSGSMDGQNLKTAKAAASLFLDELATNPGNRVGITLFSKNSQLLLGFTNDFVTAKTTIDAISESSNTCIQCGVKTANAEILAGGRVGIRKSAVLLTDGRANHIDGKDSDNAQAVLAAKNEVLAGHNTSGTVFYTIGFGNSVNTEFMTQAATSTGGIYYFAYAADALPSIFNEIAKSVCQPGVTP
jgi:uncharacterized protein YegL